MPQLFRASVNAIFLIATSLAFTPTLAENNEKARASGSARPAKAAAAPALLYAPRNDAMELADAIAERQGLDPAWVRAMVGQARQLPTVTRLMRPAGPGQAKNWNLYRSRFVEPIRIRAGLRFWNANAAALARAEQEFGVPAEIIVGIIGVETIYGRQMGNFRVMDALATLAFDFPQEHPRAEARSTYFRGELEQFLAFNHRAGTDPFAARGSYAGAMGLGQFMPSSWVRFAIDYDGDGRIDLFKSPTDAIGSVANYFRGHGWTPGMPTHYGVQLRSSDTQMATLMEPDIRPTFSAAAFQDLGALLDAAGQMHARPLALIELQNGPKPPVYVAGTENFYSITRYNWSSYYAMAVIDLGQAVAAARDAR